MRRVEFIMGMPIILEVTDCSDDNLFDRVFGLLQQIDEQYSPFKPTSEVFRFLSGEISERKLSHQLKKIIKECKEAEDYTDGAFSAWASGTFDPSGYVKGWAIDQACHIVESAGFDTYCLGAGGDIKARSKTDKVWKIGVQYPLDKQATIGTIAGTNIAVATSGNYERGSHIFNPKTRQPVDELLSITVVGLDIIKADILATAGFVMGPKAIEFISTKRGFDALAVDRSGQVLMTPDMGEYLLIA